jgi:hypothetical protein
MSLFVVLALSVDPSTEELNEYSKKNGHNIEYTHETKLSEISGFLPAKLNNQDAGVEVYSFPASELPPPFKPIIGEDYNEGVVFQFRFGGNPIEAQTAFTTAIILNSKYGGIAVEDQSGSVMTIEQLTQAISHLGAM